MPTPSLVAICITALAADNDALYALHTLPFRLAHRPPNLLSHLVPDPAALDPRLWAVLTQLYPSLPSFFAAYALPLADPDLPLLQSIPATPLFSLVTLLNLSSSLHLTDQSIFKLKFLHALTALDASDTAITTYAIKSLASTLQPNEDEDSPRQHRGPWEIRILSLRNCKHICNDIYFELTKFPLLSVVDLRGTLCTRSKASPFRPSMHSELYYPATLRDSLRVLQSIQPELSASPVPYILTIDKLNHPRAKATPPQGRVGIQDSFVVFPSNPTRKINVGNTYVLERQVQEREERIKHEKNKDAWYERKERIEDNEYYEDEKNILRKQVKRDLAGLSPLQNASTRLRSKPTSNLRLPSTSASENSYPRLSVARAHVSSSESSPSLSINCSHPNLHHPSPHTKPLSQQQLPYPHHSLPVSESALSLVSVRRPPMKALPTTSGSDPRPLNASTNAIECGEHTNITVIRSGDTNVVIQNRHTRPNETGSVVESVISDPGASSTSPRLPLTSLTVPALSTRTTTTPRATSNASAVTPAQFYEPLSQARRSAPALKLASNSADAHLMLLRAPPAYHTLSEALAQEQERRTHGNTRALNSLNGTAVLSRHGKWALNAQEAMEGAVKNRMGSGGEMKRMPVVPPVSLAKSTVSRASSSVPSLSSSLAAANSSAVMESSTQAPSRNPFRKRVLSYPDMPGFGDGSNAQARSSSSSSSLASFNESSMKAAMKSPRGSSTTMQIPGRDKPNSKSGMVVAPSPVPRASCATATLSAPSTPTGMQRMNAALTLNPHPKPFIPISAVKVPVLSDDMRQEAAQREALLASRKRNRVDEETEDVAAKPSVKKVANSLSTRKIKKQEKTKAFDWTSWGKKDTLT